MGQKSAIYVKSTITRAIFVMLECYISIKKIVMTYEKSIYVYQYCCNDHIV